MKSPLAERLGLLQMDRIGKFLTNELLPLIVKGVVATGAEAPEEEFADSQDAANWDAVVSQSIDALHSLLLADGQPDIAIAATPSGDLSQLRLTAAGRLIGLTRHRAYQRRLTRPDLLQAL
uniref:Transcriptional regulator n=1 Tax=Macrostomum lignano TaxID=282301 RepID=A0A1I8I6M0_9PLAT